MSLLYFALSITSSTMLCFFVYKTRPPPLCPSGLIGPFYLKMNSPDHALPKSGTPVIRVSASEVESTAFISAATIIDDCVARNGDCFGEDLHPRDRWRLAHQQRAGHTQSAMTASAMPEGRQRTRQWRFTPDLHPIGAHVAGAEANAPAVPKPRAARSVLAAAVPRQ